MTSCHQLNTPHATTMDAFWWCVCVCVCVKVCEYVCVCVCMSFMTSALCEIVLQLLCVCVSVCVCVCEKHTPMRVRPFWASAFQGLENSIVHPAIQLMNNNKQQTTNNLHFKTPNMHCI